MGDMEMIWADGSGIQFTENGITSQHYAPCDSCYKMTPLYNLRSMLLGLELDAIWLCKECHKVK